MEWVHRFLKSGLGGDPRDNIRALDSIRGYRMGRRRQTRGCPSYPGRTGRLVSLAEGNQDLL